MQIQPSEKYGRLTILHRLPSDGSGKAKWACECECGKVVPVATDKLRSGHTKSCGCYRLERCKATSTTHGHSTNHRRTRVYRIWAQMLQRCLNSNDQAYPWYGGRGIMACDRWQESFENFLEDMGEPPTAKHSLDRVNVNGNYEPDNTRWATLKEQGRNTRSNRLLTHNGRTMTMVEWSEETGIPYGVLNARINGYKWNAARALETPVSAPRADNKLTSQQVKDIVDAYAKGEITQRRLAQKYAVSISMINYIVTGKDRRTIVLDRDAIREAIRNDEETHGAELGERGTHLRIR